MTKGRFRLVLAAAIAAALAARPGLAAAQSAVADATPRATERSAPGWMVGWSPLAPIADLPRRIPRPPAPPDLALVLDPQLGLFWTGGNPAGLPGDVNARWNELEARVVRDDGRYRRPMDPGRATAFQFAGLGLQPVGGSAAAAGRVLVDQENLDRAGFDDLIEPYSSDPFVVADSTFPRMRRIRARLEGAFGLRLGRWDAGLATGVEVRDHRSREAPFARIGHTARQGVVLGLARRLPVAGLAVGAHGRWTRGSEAVTLFPNPRSATEFDLEGLTDPVRRRLAPPSGGTRRYERSAWLWGLDAAGTLAGAEWALTWESTHRTDANFTDLISPHPDKNRWKPHGWTLRGAAARGVVVPGLRATVRAAYMMLEGDATRPDLSGAIFRADEKSFDATIDVRYRPLAAPWAAGLAFTLRRESRLHRDFIAETRSDVTRWLPGAAVSVARTLGATTVAAGYSRTFYTAVSVIPNPAGRESAYRLLIAPELSFYATQTRPSRVRLAIRHRLSEGASLLLAGDREAASPFDRDPNLPFAPRGDRTLWDVSLAVILE